MGGQALVYLVPRNKIELLAVPAYLWSIVVAALGFMFLHHSTIIHVNHVSSVAILSVLSSFICIHQTILFARQEINIANLITLLSVLLQCLGILFCFYVLHINNDYAFIYASLVAYAVVAAVSFLFVQKQIHFSAFISHFSWQELRQSFRFGLLYQLVEILQLLNLRYYFFQLGLQQGVQYLGIYSIGISILEAVWIIPRSICTVHYVATSNSEEIKNKAVQTVSYIKVSLAVCALILLLLYFIPSQVYVFIFGPGFSDVKHSMRFLFPGIWVYTIPIVISSFYFGTGRYFPLVLTHIIGTATLILFSFFLIPSYVMSGAGLAATISFTGASIVLLMYFMHEQKISYSQFFGR